MMISSIFVKMKYSKTRYTSAQKNWKDWNIERMFSSGSQGLGKRFI